MFDQQRGPNGPLLVGSVAEVLDKIGRQHELFGHDRVLAHVDFGGMAFERVAETVEVLAAEVLPAVRDMTG